MDREPELVGVGSGGEEDAGGAVGDLGGVARGGGACTVFLEDWLEITEGV